MVVRLIIGRTGCPIVRVERFKMLASGTQLVAIGVFAAAIVAPSFNPSLHPTHAAVVTGGLVAALIELLALRFMGASPPRRRERRMKMLELVERLILAGVPFITVVWLGLYIERRWIGLPRQN